MLDEKTLQLFRKWGAQGGKAKAKKYTRRQLSEMAKSAAARKSRKNGAR